MQVQLKGKHGTPRRNWSKATKTRLGRVERPVPGVPVRTCIGCRAQATPSTLVRMVLAPDGGIAFDLAGGALGRGAWVHPQEACLRKATKATGRHLGADGSENVEGLLLSLAASATRRAIGLLGAAHRARHVALGSDAAKEAYQAGRAKLVVLATDAKAAKSEPWLETALVQGIVVGWATKSELGAIVGRDELAIIVVTDEGLARSLERVIAMTTPVTSRLAKSVVSSLTTGSQGREDSEDG